MIWLSETLTSNVHKVEMLPKTLSDNYPVALILKEKLFRWKLNEMLSQKEIVVENWEKKKLIFFLK